MGRKRRVTTQRATQRAVAWHEAGHAVVSLWLGLPVYEVSIVPDGDTLGKVEHPTPLMLDLLGGLVRERRKAARAMILAAFAGVHAQRLVEPDAPDWYGDQDSENAFELSKKYGVVPRSLAHFGDDQHWAYLERLRRESGRLVSSPAVKAAIAQLAEHLLQVQRTMSADEVEAFLQPHLRE